MKHAVMPFLFAVSMTLAAVAASVAAPVDVPRIVPLQSDSACAGPMPNWPLNDYIRRCSDLITQLNDTKTRCGRIIVEPPSVPLDRTDPQHLCTQDNMNRINRQLAAALNDRAYFFILCKGTKNYEEALKDLDKAIGLFPDYWLAFRNHGITNMLLGRFDDARKDFIAVVGATNMSNPGANVVRDVTQGEARLGLGYAFLGLCDVPNADEQLFEAERLTIGPVGRDRWLHAAAIFGQGLVMSTRSAIQSRIAATNRAVTPSERGRLQRDADRKTDEAMRKMDAAKAIIATIEDDVRSLFYLDAQYVTAKCQSAPAGS